MDILIGCLALLAMIVDLGHDRLSLYPAVLGLVVGAGLLRQRDWARPAAQVFAWGLVVLVGLAGFLLLVHARAGPHASQAMVLVLGEWALASAFGLWTEVVMRQTGDARDDGCEP